MGKIEGRFLIGTGSNKANTTSYWGELSANNHAMPVGEMGGEAKHILSVQEMPSHQHEISLSNGGDLYTSAVDWKVTQTGRTYAGDMISATGNNQPHNNIPPYYAVNMWQRIS